MAALIYSSLALAEIGVLLLSAGAVLVLVVRGAIRAFRPPPSERRPPKAEDLRHLKRAGQSGPY
jgi:hypothetical protein